MPSGRLSVSTTVTTIRARAHGVILRPLIDLPNSVEVRGPGSNACQSRVQGVARGWNSDLKDAYVLLRTTADGVSVIQKKIDVTKENQEFDVTLSGTVKLGEGLHTIKTQICVSYGLTAHF
jgi:hypothetical protein